MLDMEHMVLVHTGSGGMLDCHIFQPKNVFMR